MSLFAEWSTEFKNKPGYETLANLHNSVAYRSNTNNAGYITHTRKGSSSSNVNKERNKNESSSKKGQQSERRPVTYSSEKVNIVSVIYFFIYLFLIFNSISFKFFFRLMKQ